MAKKKSDPAPPKHWAPVPPPPEQEDPPMANRIHDDDEPTTNAAEKVTVKALKYHTLAGEEHQEGETYDVDANLVDTLLANGMAAPVD